MLKTKEEIEHWLDKYSIKNYTINNDLSVDVNGDVINLNCKGLFDIPIQFGTINGSFYCSYNNLYTLKGCPLIVNDVFCCQGNSLLSLKHLPIVKGELICDREFFDSIEYKRWKLIRSLRK